MKKTIRLIAIYATLGLIAPLFANVIELKAQTPAQTPAPAKAQTPAPTPAPAKAQTPAPTPAPKAQTPAPAAAQGQCTAENKQAWYTEFRAIFKTEQTKAYDLAQKYLACPAEAGEESIRVYLKNYMTVIEKSRRAPQVTELAYIKKDYAKAFELGKQVLAEEPDNVVVLMGLSWAGNIANSSKVETYNVDALNYAKKAMELIQAGKGPENWAPYVGKDEALAYLNSSIGALTIGKNPSEALPYLIKAAQLEGKLKKEAITYGYIGDAYQSGPYDRLSAEYKTLYEGKDETPESKLALENVNQVIDRMIDAYARAVSLSGSEPANQAAKKAWMETLTTWYKYRNKSDAGLTDMIAKVMSTPLPPQPTPLTTLPATAPTTTTTTAPASGAPTTGAGNATAPAATGKPAAAPATAPATTAPKTATATPTPTPEVKPKP